jgi:hypothetical protein
MSFLYIFILNNLLMLSVMIETVEQALALSLAALRGN